MRTETAGWDAAMSSPCRKCEHYVIGALPYRNCVMHRDEWDDDYWEHVAPWNRRRSRQAWVFKRLDEIEAWCNRELDWVRNARLGGVNNAGLS